MSKPLGLMQWTEGTTGTDLVQAVRRFESLGYHELWLPEIFGREPFATAGYLLAKTERVRVSSGIALRTSTRMTRIPPRKRRIRLRNCPADGLRSGSAFRIRCSSNRADIHG